MVQELNGTIPKSNLLTGGTDQRFTRTDSAGTRTYLTDALGSPVAMADQSGALQTQYTNTPFGKATPSGPASANTFQFTGRENDGTGLQYNRARYYHPTFGRFISEDPLGLGAGDPNLYGYVGNSPFNLTDPSGMIVPWAGACLGGAAFGAAVHVIDMNLSGRKANVGGVLAAGGIGCGETLVGLGLGRVLGKVASRSTRNIVYRGLDAGENPALGLTARAPGIGNTPVSHVAGARQSQWISTTRSRQIAEDV